MEWFELNTKELGYINLMGISRAEDKVLIAAPSFSDIPWYSYVAFVLLLLGLGWVGVQIVRALKLKIGSYWKVSSLLLLVMSVYAAFFVTMLWKVPFPDIPVKLREGEFGDSFGTLNTLFSGLAFSGVLISLLFQRKDLAETRGQVARQQFESQFYNMLALQHSVVSEFDLNKDGVVIRTGRDCFKSWCNYLRQSYVECSTERRIDGAYAELWKQHRGDLSLYYRSLYSVFRYVSDSGHADKVKFGTIARSFLSDFELVILFYNCLSDKGYNFRKYAKEFAIFNNLDPMMLMDPRHVALLDFQVYGKNLELLNYWTTFKYQKEE
ncbi:putative phage abortive infection protein [Pseudomonas putida]|uniref:Phage abortive infection protein n=1 Tax=Pseudomonas putida TaxID=303 RepID=A0AAW4C1U8_PSEPU|nr:putative phage abortive infection protein [Pseudomonas putida]MBF8703976.1 hypothetical protein [Pseudomonas putida]MBF8738720.1 hypothetical protein [Pseudomonas putida]